MNAPADTPTLRALLTRGDLRLTLAEDDGLDPAALDRAVRWVHSSDLSDPTPFLSEGLVLLTTGTQFTDAGDDVAPYRAYVHRLAARGVVGLGFGTEVVRAGLPPALAHACRDERMPLFEVPYRTPGSGRKTTPVSNSARSVKPRETLRCATCSRPGTSERRRKGA